MALPPFPTEALDLPDDELGKYILAWWAAYQLECKGIPYQAADEEILEKIRIGTLGMDSDNAELSALEKSLRLAASGDVTRAGKLFRQYSLKEAKHQAACDEAVTGRRRQRAYAKKPRVDPLHEMIDEILEKNPQINTAGLLSELRAREGISAIDEIDEDKIYFEDGRKPAKISGLKDRLGRARKKFSSR
jgi:hypothetical protein